jgi:3-oxocholest-4-en-26-oate---CoA ligase
MWSAEIQRGLLRHLDVRLVDSMGSTEGGMAKRIVTRDIVVETARFEPLAGTKLVADDGRVIDRTSTERGRVAASAVVPLRYRNDPDKSAATFVEIDGVRHALAGDWAVWADDGTMVLLGRGSNCINTAGEKVFPEEVEEAMKRHPLVADCLVVGLPDDRFGERIAAVISLRPFVVDEGPPTPIDVDAITAEVRTWLAGYKVPRAVVIVEEVRRAANGKADYPWARSVLDAT